MIPNDGVDGQARREGGANALRAWTHFSSCRELLWPTRRAFLFHLHHSQQRGHVEAPFLLRREIHLVSVFI